jgi:CheY-like chemotaxis protein
MKYKKIMVVDDNRELLELISKRLKLEKAEVMCVVKGEEVMAAVKQFKPEAILMDIVLEDIDGAEVVRRLQQDLATQHIPVIFLSGIVTEDAERNKTKLKVGEYQYDALGKPFKFEDLLEKLK